MLLPEISNLDVIAQEQARARQNRLQSPREVWAGWKNCPFS